MTDLGGLDDLIRKLQSVDGFLTKSAPLAAEAGAAQIRADLAAGRAPGGGAWPPKKDGGAPLANASGKLQVRTSGTTLIFSFGWPEALHNVGAKNLPQRPVLPTALTPAMAQAIKAALLDAWGSL